MRIVFFGTGSFAVPALEALSESIILVVTQPDRPSGRGMKLHSTPVKFAAEKLGLQIASPERARDVGFVERLESLEPDVLLVASYGQILSQRILDSAKLGGINLHGSILPKFRGAAPIQRAILEGETYTGITLMQMDRGMDSGDVISTSVTEIGVNETYGALQDRLALIAAQMALDWMPKIVKGQYPRTPQNPDLMTLAPKIDRTETQLQTNRRSEEEYNRYRAFTPNPGTFLMTNLGRIKVIEACPGVGTGTPGTVLSTSDGLEIAFAEGSLRFLQIQPEGKNSMSAKQYALGARLNVGDSWIKI